jgi:hypothetical protein
MYGAMLERILLDNQQFPVAINYGGSTVKSLEVLRKRQIIIMLKELWLDTPHKPKSPDFFEKSLSMILKCDAASME